MNLSLSTMDIWVFEDEFTPTALLRQLGTLLQHDDVIAFGAYRPSPRLLESALARQATATDSHTIYSVTFDLNRVEHPNGRSFELPVSDAILEALALEAERPDGQDDKPLFFDHLVAYRRGIPAVPLLCFHDAFSGGTLAVSGLYPETIVRSFAAKLPSTCALRRNPENYQTGA